MRRTSLLTSIAVLALAALASPAHAAFGFAELDMTMTEEDGSPATQAGSHPHAQTAAIGINTVGEGEAEIPAEDMKDLTVDLPPGLIGDPSAIESCPTATFVLEKCPPATQLGEAEITILGPSQVFPGLPVYSLPVPPGKVLRFGFIALAGVPVTIDVGVRQSPPFNVFAASLNTTNGVPFYRSELTIFGRPEGAERPFLTLPRACTGPLPTRVEALSWQNPGGPTASGEVLTHDDAIPPNPLGMGGCSKLAFGPTANVKPTTLAAESPTGLDVELDVVDAGLTSPEGNAQSDIRKVVVTLPEGMTVNPSSAEGVAVCTEADFARQSLQAPGQGCPDASKLGVLQVQSPILPSKTLEGGVFLAEPYKNPFDTLLALYLTIENRSLGIMIKQSAKVEADPKTGQLVATVTDIPQYPIAHVGFKFREGARSPLVSPPTCGEHKAITELTPWSGGTPVVQISGFQISTGPGGGPCPAGSTPPFEPGFEGGTQNNAAGSYSPFDMRITRRDGDQDLTKFSADLPPGVVARLAGTTKCPEAAIAQARSRSGRGGGALELASPSCPASSQIGTVLGGAGVGAVLTYVPGKAYLAGPFNGAPLSAVGVVPAVAGPFDIGTVVVRFALRINPRTTKVSVDGSASDPIPHILAGIPLKVRDIRASIDRPNFTINPTSCDPFEVGSTLWGGGADVFSTVDDSPVSRTRRFQAADCASLGFKPRLFLKLKGQTQRGAHPALSGTYVPRAGQANLASLVLRLPPSAFLDQAHIRTICTRVQFAAKNCPSAAVYGRATAYTPLLEGPLSGPVYLRSSDNKLPDFVADLHGVIDVEAVAKIDSKNGGIRATFSNVPDAPLSKVVVQMQGGKKGLIVNSRNICLSKSRANALFSAQNNARHRVTPVVEPRCGKDRKAKRSGHGRG